MKKILTISALLLTAAWAQASLSYGTFGGSYGGTGVTIQDGSPVGQFFNTTASGLLPTVGSVAVELDITGGFNGNLYAYLVHDGRVVTLLNQPGVTGGNPFGAMGSGMNVLLTDGSTGTQISLGGVLQSPILGNINTYGETAGGPLNGTFNADGTLANFDGLTADGQWTLFVADLVSGGGRAGLVSWSVDITAVPEPVTMALATFFAMLLALGGLKWAWSRNSKS